MRIMTATFGFHMWYHFPQTLNSCAEPPRAGGRWILSGRRKAGRKRPIFPRRPAVRLERFPADRRNLHTSYGIGDPNTLWRVEHKR